MVWPEIINNKHANLPLKRIRQSRSNNKGRLLQFSIQKQEYLNFISNDYLGLSYHLALKNAIISGTENYGAGSTGAASLSGYSQEQELLSQELANWLKCEACLICNSGYTLNWGLYQPLVTSQVTAWLDENCHASHIDGILFSRAKFRQFGKHSINDIQMAINNDVNRLHLIVSEGIFSMDGSSTHLDKLIQLRKKFPDQVLLILDDAHGLGTTGVNAWGQLGMLGHSPNDVDLLIGTLGKTFGSHGAFIAGKETIINYLQQSIRSQIYTTSLPPAIHAASRAALARANAL